MTDIAHALVIVDVQRAFVFGPDAVPDHQRLMHCVGALLDRARIAGAPVVFLQNDGPQGSRDQPGTEGWALAFAPRPDEGVVRKSHDGGFDGTDLEARLRAVGAETLALCGMLSEMCLAATAREAVQRGFKVLLAHEAHATYDVPAGPGGSLGVPARLAARAAEWSLGDEIVILGGVHEITFEPPKATAPPSALNRSGGGGS